MEYKDIELLLSKFFDGETSIEEEKFIRDFFRNNSNLPKHLKEIEALFAYFEQESLEKLAANVKLSSVEKPLKKTKIRRLYYLASGIAASILLLIGVFNYSNNSEEQKIYAYINGKPIMNKQLAEEETKKALLLISSNFNQGTENLGHLSNFSKAESLVSGSGSGKRKN